MKILWFERLIISLFKLLNINWEWFQVSLFSKLKYFLDIKFINENEYGFWESFHKYISVSNFSLVCFRFWPTCWEIWSENSKMFLFLFINTRVDTEMCCPKGKCGEARIRYWYLCFSINKWKDFIKDINCGKKEKKRKRKQNPC
jgi:hypothetical protein